MTTADLGWCLARCSVSMSEAELTICSPASDDEAAGSLTLVGLEAIIALRDLIDDELALVEARATLAEELPPVG